MLCCQEEEFRLAGSSAEVVEDIAIHSRKSRAEEFMQVLFLPASDLKKLFTINMKVVLSEEQNCIQLQLAGCKSSAVWRYYSD